MSTAEYYRAYYLANREKIIQRALRWRAKNPEKWLASQNKSAKKRHAHLRNVVMDAYGRECACCGEKESRFLTIDHVHGSGNKHRRELCNNNNSGGAKFYKWLQDNKFPSEYRILCWNCNCGRAINGGVCPHEEERVKNTEAPPHGVVAQR